VLGFRSLLAVAVGLVVSQGVMVMILQGVGIGGLGFFMPLTIAFFLAISYAFSFSELTLMLPRAGSLSTYTDVAIGPLPAMVATYSGYVVVSMFALSAELLLVDLILRDLFPEIFSPMIVATGILLVFTWLWCRYFCQTSVSVGFHHGSGFVNTRRDGIDRLRLAQNI